MLLCGLDHDPDRRVSGDSSRSVADRLANLDGDGPPYTHTYAHGTADQDLAAAYSVKNGDEYPHRVHDLDAASDLNPYRHPPAAAH